MTKKFKLWFALQKLNREASRAKKSPKSLAKDEQCQKVILKEITR